MMSLCVPGQVKASQRQIHAPVPPAQLRMGRRGEESSAEVFLSLWPTWPLQQDSSPTAQHAQEKPTWVPGLGMPTRTATQKAASDKGPQLGKLITWLYSKEKQISSCNAGSQRAILGR